MKKYKALLLDADQTLLDFRLTEQVTLEEVYRMHGLVYDKKAAAAYHEYNGRLWKQVEMGTLTLQTLETLCLTEYFDSITDGDGLQMRLDLYDVMAKQGHLVDDCKECMPLLNEAADCYLASNGFTRLQIARCQNGGIDQYIKDYYVSDLMPFNKPRKEFFEFILKKNDLKKEDVLMVGDSLTSDIQGGINAGIDTCWINWSNKPVTDIVPTYTFKTLKEFTETFTGKKI